MGFRTVVVLNNDLAHEWEADATLGRKIWMASSDRRPGADRFQYGQVVEQVHADTQSLIIADGYGGEALSHTHWFREQSSEVRDIALLKSLASKLGYRVSKLPKKD